MEHAGESNSTHTEFSFLSTTKPLRSYQVEKSKTIGLVSTQTTKEADDAAIEMLHSAVAQDLEDEDDMMRESRPLKKLKAKKITEAEFEEKMAALDAARESARAIAVRKQKKEKNAPHRGSADGRAEKKLSLRQRRTAKKRRTKAAISRMRS